MSYCTSIKFVYKIFSLNYAVTILSNILCVTLSSKEDEEGLSSNIL